MSIRDSNTLYPYGAADAIGRRPYMEDRHLAVGRLKGACASLFYARVAWRTVPPSVPPNSPRVPLCFAPDDRTCCLYGVFDGHGGSRAAEFCVKHLVNNLVSDPHFPNNPGRALTNAFMDTDAAFLEVARSCHPPLDDGTTAVAALVIGDHLWVANAGDSRAVLVQQEGHVVAMSEDHKPNRPDETARIKRAGGTVYFHGVWRVGGILAVSRAIGDRMLKPYVTAEPELRQWRVTPADLYLVMASDGLWDVMSNDEVATIVSSMPDPQFAAQQLVRESLARGSMDNVTCLVIDLQRPQYAKLAEAEGVSGTASPPSELASAKAE